jgi:hypothetical protein
VATENTDRVEDFRHRAGHARDIVVRSVLRAGEIPRQRLDVTTPPRALPTPQQRPRDETRARQRRRAVRARATGAFPDQA